MERRWALVVGIAGMVLWGGVVGQAQAQGRSDLALAALATTPHMPGEVLVQFYPHVTERAKNDVVARIGAQREELLVAGAWRSDFKGDLELVKLPPGLAIADAVRHLESDLDVEFAEPNWIYFPSVSSNDP